MVLDYQFEPTDIGIFVTLVALEGVLSFDNAAILAALVRRLPVEQRRKALLYGIGGAYVLRVLAILSVAFIIANPILKLVGGAYLIYLSVSHIVQLRGDGHEKEKKIPSFLGLSGFWGIVLMVELADLAFALDQVLVAVALTDKIPLIVLASMTAILALRVSAAYMTRIMDWFPTLETLAYVAVGFVGLKLVAVEGAHNLGYKDFDIPKEISAAVTLSLIVVPVIVKFALEKLRPARA
ncbi:MAG TPA: hypothetical protein VM889_02625 [Candidatus Thermoplasmatota archaeon]|nr:hypothetical protein [Candidatus Thermoplasmatota archaeon]